MIINVNKDLCFVNVGEKTGKYEAANPNDIPTRRNWDNSRKFGFISAGQGRKWSKQLEGLNIGDIIVAFVTTKG